MKKLITILTLLSMTLFAAGCAEENTETAVSQETETIATEQSDENIETEETEETNILSNEEIKTLYKDAYEVYQWFDMGQLENDGEMIQLSTGALCCKVTDNRVSSMEELENIVRNTFSAEIADSLLGGGLYIEEDGVLYVQLADRGGDITKGNITEENVTNATETGFTYTVTVETIEPETQEVTGTEDIDFIAELINGKWLFTQFSSIY